MSDTATPWKFNVEREQGLEADEHRGAGPQGDGDRGRGEGNAAALTLEYKRKIVREANGCKTPGAVGALLRREALYSSHLGTWRAARERRELGGLPKKRAPAPRVTDSSRSRPDRRSLTPREPPAKLGPLVPRRKPAHSP